MNPLPDASRLAGGIIGTGAGVALNWGAGRPRAPSAFSPQVKIAPSASTAPNANSPAATAHASDMPATCCGVAGATASSRPPTPAALAPQTTTCFCAHMPRLIPCPAAMQTNSCDILTSTAPAGAFAVLQYSREPDGSRPLPSPPHPSTLPSASNANVWSRPQPIEVTARLSDDGAIKWAARCACQGLLQASQLVRAAGRKMAPADAVATYSCACSLFSRLFFIRYHVLGPVLSAGDESGNSRCQTENPRDWRRNALRRIAALASSRRARATAASGDSFVWGVAGVEFRSRHVSSPCLR
jgi:hypothetical protein